jgi:hypothetical protein
MNLMPRPQVSIAKRRSNSYGRIGGEIMAPFFR